MRATVIHVLLGVIGCVVVGCGGPPSLPATPNLYMQTDASVLVAAAERTRTTDIEILYATDRMRVEESVTSLRYYDDRRSNRLVFGRAVVRLGDGQTWEEVVAASVEGKGGVVEEELVEVEEIVEFPTNLPIPVWVDGELVIEEEHIRLEAESMKRVGEEIAARLAESSTKDVYIYIHGVGNSFEDPIYRMAQLWYYMGRPGVAMVYTWPAKKGGGPLRGYTYSRESSEYTLNHLRQFLESVASVPEVEQMHILAHSRGTGIALSALQQLRLIYLDDPEGARRDLKLGQIVLAAPDIDLQVAQQLYRPDRIDEIIDRLTIYLTPKDDALGIAEWLFGGLARLGSMKGITLNEESIRAFNEDRVGLDGIIVKTKRLGAYEHTYWVDNPAVLSDVILVLRDERRAGAEHGRPLLRQENGFWLLEDGYPYEGAHAPAE